MSKRLSRIQIGEWIDIAARQVPDKALWVCGDGRSITYAESQLRVHRLASALAKRGVEQHDRVAILAIDSPEYMETILAIAKLGAVAVPLNYRLKSPEVELLLGTGRPKYLFVSSRYVEIANDIVTRLPEPCDVVGYDGGDTIGAIDFLDLLAEGDDRFADVEVDEDDMLSLSFTSGTTGLPKGVMQSHRMFKQMGSNTILEYRFQRDEFRYSAAPMFHIAGMGLVINCILRCQSALILPQFDAETVVAWMRKGVTGVFLVPTMISSILKVPSIREGGFESVKTIFYGAAPMTPTLLRETIEIFGEDCDFYNGFSAGTEAGMQTLLTPEDHRRALAGEPHLLESIGRPGYAVDLRLVDDDMNDVPRGTVGEIATRSDMVMNGYLDQPERTAQAVVDGWIRAGDLAWQDDEGYLYLAGRKNDMIIRGGENVYPVEIESVLAEYPGLFESAVVGVPDDHWGEVVKAFVVMSDGTEVDIDHLRAFCGERLARYKVPEIITVLPELPKNASGKILKRELRQWT
ncbi:MAG: class I adenylate-forming enzyme family protein [Acidimicrobiia bacterium]